MKILFVSALLPYPLHSGGQVRVYNLLKRLGSKHEITLFSFLRSSAEREYIENLEFCKKVETVYRGHAWQPKYVVRSLLSTYPLLFTTYAISEMREKIERELATQEYDLIHIEPSYVWLALPRVSIPIVVGEHNIEYVGYKGYVDRFPFVPFRPFLMADVAKLAWWERRVWRIARRIISVSNDDRDVIKRVAGDKKIDVVPNGVDLSEFRFRQPKAKINSPVFLFVGNFSWLQNRDAVKFLLRGIWPLLSKRYPAAKLRIVGRGASSDIRLMINGSAQLLDGVDEITKEYSNADILIAPIRIGSGSRYKILEAMASGLPVITTSAGAAGLGTESGRDLMLAEAPEDFVFAAEKLMSDQRLRGEIAKSARKRIEASFSWEIIADKLENVWKQVKK